MRVSHILVLVIPFILGLQTATAGTVVTWELPTKDMRFKVEYLDAQHLRMSIEDELYLLIKDTGIYMVNGKSITDVNAFRGKIKDWTIVQYLAKKMDSRSKRVPEPDKLEATGKMETVAGITGEIYHAVITNNETGLQESREIVLTKNPRMVALKKIMQAISDENMRSFHNKGFENMKSAMKNSFPPDVAILRYGNKFQVASFVETNIDKVRFQLPNDNPIKTLPSLSDLSTFVRLAAPFSY
ncbi:MAG: hypothetical protein KUG76_04555 [Gammaproteobacteria bacterium]|nr:hypothetical protein [Gammaproteobacteria bacterium]